MSSDATSSWTILAHQEFKLFALSVAPPEVDSRHFDGVEVNRNPFEFFGHVMVKPVIDLIREVMRDLYVGEGVLGDEVDVRLARASQLFGQHVGLLAAAC